MLVIAVKITFSNLLNHGLQYQLQRCRENGEKIKSILFWIKETCIK